MKRAYLLIGASLALTSVWAIAQDAPESLLPPGFDDPAPSAPSAPAPRAVRSPAAPAQSTPIVQPLPGATPVSDDPVVAGPADEVRRAIESLTVEEIEKLSPEELEEVLGLSPQFDIPPAARRSMNQVGILAESEGGMRPGSFTKQDVSLVRAALGGNKGLLVSRWGHILLRRALASRFDAPEGMNPADFAALRASLLLRMGEGEAARALVQDVDTGNYTPGLIDAAFNAYVATADFTGICPAQILHGSARKDPQWDVSGEICRVFRGDGNAAMARLDRATARETLPRIDMLLAQKYAGAVGKVRRAVTIEWDDVKEMTPWRYGLAIAVGVEPPESLMKRASVRYSYLAATAPMLGLDRRAEAADAAAGAGILSSAAMVDLYGQLYADGDTAGVWAERTEQLREAYVGASPSVRLSAMQKLWDSTQGAGARYSRQVLTAYAAARMPVDQDFADDAPALIASMLTAGLDRNAMRWADVVQTGTQAWALLVLAAPSRGSPVASGALDSFVDDDASDGQRKSAFLVAGLAGLGRITPATRDSFADRLNVDMKGQTRWTRMIDKAAQVRNPAMVAVLAGVGMQGTSWAKMTPRYLFHIVSALRQVGLEAEARMIAAEAVARG